MKEKTIWRLTSSDFNSIAESLLGRKLNKEEIDDCISGFCLENWTDEVETYLECNFGEEE